MGRIVTYQRIHVKIEVSEKLTDQFFKRGKQQKFSFKEKGVSNFSFILTAGDIGVTTLVGELSPSELLEVANYMKKNSQLDLYVYIEFYDQRVRGLPMSMNIHFPYFEKDTDWDCSY